jgi:hypothetical protein
VEEVNVVLLAVGRFVTGMSMIIGGSLTIYSLIRKHTKNEREERKD